VLSQCYENEACLMKLAWELRSGSNTLWFRVMEDKYNRANMEDDVAEAKASNSSLWKTLVRMWPNYAQFDYRSHGNDKVTLAWHHSWIEVDGKISD